MPVEDFPNVVRLEKLAAQHLVQVDTPDTAPTADPAEQGLAAQPTAEATPKAPPKPAEAPAAESPAAAH
jgi:hypothetical protein